MQLGRHTPYTYMLGSSSYQVLSPLRYTHMNVSSHRFVGTIQIQTKVPILESERVNHNTHIDLSVHLWCVEDGLGVFDGKDRPTCCDMLPSRRDEDKQKV